MVYSKEFFNQRSFEVVWAVFRVAEFSARGKMREALETKALDYLIAKNIYSLADLEGVVTLAINVGDVSQTNGGVILREVNNLKAAIEELRIREERLAIPAKSPDKAPNIEGVFSKPPMLFAEFVKTVERVNGVGDSGEKGVMSDEKVEAVVNKGENNKEQVNEPFSEAKWKQSGNKVETKWKSEGIVDFPISERQTKIVKILSEKPIIKVGDLPDFFDNVTSRTLRNDVQKLVENGVIEKLGGGPSSFLRIKRGKK